MKSVSLHIFNPWHDMALANYRPNYQPPASAMKMAHDLALLPRWIAREGDVILHSDYSLWQVCDGQPVKVEKPESLSRYEIKPWGWDLLICRMLQKKYPSLALPSADYVDKIRKLSSRETAVNTLRRLMERDKELYIGESFFCTDLQEVAALVRRYPRVLLKQLWSSSGKGLKPADGTFEVPVQNWCRKSISMHGGVVLEPRYDRVLDFAMEFCSSAGEVAFCGYSVFLTSDTGMYAGNMLDTEENLEQYILAKLEQNTPSVLEKLKGQLIEILTNTIAPYYQGPFGVDMMVVRAEDGSLKIHPCVEINLRFNMGQLAAELSRKLLTPGRKGLFKIEFFSNPEELVQRHLSLSEREGYRLLAPVLSGTNYLAYALME